MPCKRVAPMRLFGNGIPTPRIEAYSYEYYRPGCYYTPQIERLVTPYINTYTNHWIPYSNTVTYVLDRYGRANYLSDFEYQLQVTSPLPKFKSRKVIYNFYNDGEVELSSLPQIEEEDYDDDQDVCIRKRKRVNVEDCYADMPMKLAKTRGEEFEYNNVYRSTEGYLVEEPNDNVPDSV